MKNLFKCLAWAAVIIAISLAIVYGFWLILIFMLFEETVKMYASIAGTVVMVLVWWKTIGLALC